MIFNERNGPATNKHGVSACLRVDARPGDNNGRQSSTSDPNSKHWFTTSFLQPLPYLVTPWSRKLSANESVFFVVVVGGGAQTVVRVLQTAQIKPGVSLIAASKVYTSTNKTTIV